MKFSVFNTEIENMNQEIEEENKAVLEKQRQMEQMRSRYGRR